MKSLITHPTDFLGRLIVPTCYVAHAVRSRLEILRVSALVPKKDHHQLLCVNMDGQPRSVRSDTCIVVQL